MENEMTNSPPLTTLCLVLGLIFLMIAVVGKSKFGFAEINPGGFGRFLALILGIACLMVAVCLVIFPFGILLEVIKNFLTEQLQQNINSLTQLKPSSWLTD